MTETTRPLGPPEDPDRFEDFEDCVTSLMDDDDLDREEAERICGAWKEATETDAHMTDDQPEYRAYHQPDSDHVRQVEETGEGTFVVRMPIASTGEVRNEGDEPLTRDELAGMAQQIEERAIAVFLDHGRSGLAPSRYGAVEKVGEWRSADIETRDGVDTLDAEAELMDPATLPDEAATLREKLTALKEQVKRDFALSASIGWAEDEDAPGGNDLMEASIVGIPADPRTTSQDAPVEALARAAVQSGADAEVYLERVERALAGTDARARAEYEVNGETVDITPPDAVVNAAEAALDAVDRGLGADCGTGVGTQRANQILDDAVGPDVVDEVAAYLTSHEEDVTAEGPPTDWSDEEWADCGNLQYAKWGGTGTGTGLEWAQDRANAVADARGEELPYPDRAATPDRNLDDPEFDIDDPVEWTSNDVIVRGRVADIGDEFEPAEGVTITGDEGEAVYLIHELDDSLDPPQYRRENVAKPESSLDESQADLPPATEDNFADNDSAMSDTEQSGEQSDTTDDAQTGDRAMSDMVEEVAELQERQSELIEELRATDMDDEDDDEDDDMDDDEQAANAAGAETPEDDQDADDTEDIRERIAKLEGELAAARSGGVGGATADSDDTDTEADDAAERESDDAEDSTTNELSDKYGIQP